MSNSTLDAHTGTAKQVSTSILCPPEILVQIFHLVIIPPRNEYGYTTIDHNANGPLAQLIRLCLVCRSWRVAALTSRTLWTYIYNPNSAFLEEAISRSGSSPLTLALSNAEDLHFAIQLSAPRLRELRVYFPQDPSSQGEFNNFPETPILTSITVVAQQEAAAQSSWPLLTISRLLRAPSPNLQHLILRNCPLPIMPYPTFSKLRYFSFALQGQSMAPNIRVLLKTLEHMPQLVYLFLNLESSNELVEIDQDPIVLSNLITIELAMSVGHCDEILSAHFQDPDHVQMTLDSLFNTMGITPDSIIPPRPFSHGFIDADREHAELKLWNSPIDGIPHVNLPQEYPFQISIEEAYPPLDFGLMGILKNLVISPPHRLDHLAISAPSHLSFPLRQRFLEFFQNSVLVKTLQFRSTSFPTSLLDLMCYDDTRPLPDVPPFACLERLSFVEVAFDSLRLKWSMKQIRDYVVYRDDQGISELEEVEFDACRNLTEDAAEELRELVREYDVEIKFTAGGDLDAANALEGNDHGLR